MTTLGFLVGGLGHVVTALVLAGRHDSVLIAAGLLLFGVGMGGAFALLLTNILVDVPPTSTAASGLVTTTSSSARWSAWPSSAACS